jgi:hypothetical protein
MANQLFSCDPVEVTPALEIEIEPNWLVTIMSAQAAIGNANASNARTNTRLILIPPQIFALASSLLNSKKWSSVQLRSTV